MLELYRSALRILDLTDLDAPRLIGTYDAAPRAGLLGLVASGHYAYMATGSGILAVDFADPTRPTQVGFVPADGYDPALIESDAGGEPEATVKRYLRDGPRVVLKPGNPRMAPIVVDPARRPVRILGKVIGLLRGF